MPTVEPTELTDAEVAARLSGESIHPTRTFRGRQLAAYTKGARDICLRVIRPDDSAAWHDVILLRILADLHAGTPEAKLARRREVMLATQDADTFRAAVSLELDDYTDADLETARGIVDAILTPVNLAQVVVVPPKGGALRAKKKRA